MSRTLLPVLCLLCLLVLGCPAILARSHDTGEEASSGSGEGTTDEGSADAPDVAALEKTMKRISKSKTDHDLSKNMKAGARQVMHSITKKLISHTTEKLTNHVSSVIKSTMTKKSRNSTVTGDTKQTEPTHMDSQPQALENSTDISEAKTGSSQSNKKPEPTHNDTEAQSLEDSPEVTKAVSGSSKVKASSEPTHKKPEPSGISGKSAQATEAVGSGDSSKPEAEDSNNLEADEVGEITHNFVKAASAGPMETLEVKLSGQTETFNNGTKKKERKNKVAQNDKAKTEEDVSSDDTEDSVKRDLMKEASVDVKAQSKDEIPSAHGDKAKDTEQHDNMVVSDKRNTIDGQTNFPARVIVYQGPISKELENILGAKVTGANVDDDKKSQIQTEDGTPLKATVANEETISEEADEDKSNKATEDESSDSDADKRHSIAKVKSKDIKAAKRNKVQDGEEIWTDKLDEVVNKEKTVGTDEEKEKLSKKSEKGIHSSKKVDESGKRRTTFPTTSSTNIMVAKEKLDTVGNKKFFVSNDAANTRSGTNTTSRVPILAINSPSSDFGEPSPGATYHHKMLSKSDLVGIMPSQAPAADAEGSAGNPLDDKEEEGEDDDNEEPAGKKHGTDQAATEVKAPLKKKPKGPSDTTGTPAAVSNDKDKDSDKDSDDDEDKPKKPKKVHRKQKKPKSSAKVVVGPIKGAEGQDQGSPVIPGDSSGPPTDTTVNSEEKNGFNVSDTDRSKNKQHNPSSSKAPSSLSGGPPFNFDQEKEDDADEVGMLQPGAPDHLHKGKAKYGRPKKLNRKIKPLKNLLELSIDVGKNPPAQQPINPEVEGPTIGDANAEQDKGPLSKQDKGDKGWSLPNGQNVGPTPILSEPQKVDGFKIPGLGKSKSKQGKKLKGHNPALQAIDDLSDLSDNYPLPNVTPNEDNDKPNASPESSLMGGQPPLIFGGPKESEKGEEKEGVLEQEIKGVESRLTVLETAVADIEGDIKKIERKLGTPGTSNSLQQVLGLGSNPTFGNGLPFARLPFAFMRRRRPRPRLRNLFIPLPAPNSPAAASIMQGAPVPKLPYPLNFVVASMLKKMMQRGKPQGTNAPAPLTHRLTPVPDTAFTPIEHDINRLEMELGRIPNTRVTTGGEASLPPPAPGPELIAQSQPSDEEEKPQMRDDLLRSVMENFAKPRILSSEEPDEMEKVCSRTCENGGTCIGVNQCKCPSHFMGSHCQLRRSPSPTSDLIEAISQFTGRSPDSASPSPKAKLISLPFVLSSENPSAEEEDSNQQRTMGHVDQGKLVDILSQFAHVDGMDKRRESIPSITKPKLWKLKPGSPVAAGNYLGENSQRRTMSRLDQGKLADLLSQFTRPLLSPFELKRKDTIASPKLSKVTNKKDEELDEPEKYEYKYNDDGAGIR